MKFAKIENKNVVFIGEDQYKNEVAGIDYYYESDDESEGYVRMHDKNGVLFLSIDSDNSCEVSIVQIEDSYNIDIICVDDNDVDCTIDVE